MALLIPISLFVGLVIAGFLAVNFGVDTRDDFDDNRQLPLNPRWT